MCRGCVAPGPRSGPTLRALAIKEISFAASDLPVVTDQPEDAVPTRSVLTASSRTLRKQRTTRQFVLVSHDANVVVASDVEHVCALEAGPKGELHSGNLFDPVTRSAALEHLEGGQAAFELRAARYEQLQDGWQGAEIRLLRGSRFGGWVR